MACIKWLLVVALLFFPGNPLRAEDFHLDSPYNKGTLRFEIDNDAVWDEDSNFSNGWSLQYHTVRYGSWEDTRQPNFIKWIGNHFPGLEVEDSVVLNSHSIGQNMMTPGDIEANLPPPGDLPYAGTLSYSLNWQRFNRENATNFQMSVGVMGPESLAEEFQKFIHNDMGLGDDPSGWDTQRETEPILNFGYRAAFMLADFGRATNGWGGQVELSTSASLGNLFTAWDLGLGFRYGWNRLEGFTTAPAPPGRGFYSASYLPKPKAASPHSVDLLAGVRGARLFYSVLYDGSFITSDDRSVEREDFIFVGGLGLNYHYLKFFSVRLLLQVSSDILKEEELPPPPTPDSEKTSTDAAFGALIIDLYF